eukprot:12402896-Karenia_brevis.AAC.1
MGRVIKYNQIAAYSFRHRWLVRVAQALRKRMYAAVVYLECNAVFAVEWPMILAEMRSSSKPILWCGWRRRWVLSRPRHSRHMQFNLEGSKCLILRGDAVRQVFTAITQDHKYWHFDMMLCARLNKRHVAVPASR